MNKYEYRLPDIPPSTNKFIGRENRFQYQKIKKEWARLIALVCTPKPPKPIERAVVRIVYHFPDKRRRDEDNMIASMKHYLDGIAHGLRVDDRNFHLLEPFIGEPVDGGCVHADLFWKGEH